MTLSLESIDGAGTACARYASYVMHPSPSRAFAFLIAGLATFAAGAVSHRLLLRDARAQASPPSTIYVPWEGLVFRTPDGRAIARLSRDANGGVLELYDDRHAARFGAGAMGLSHPGARESYALDEEDPWAGAPSHKPPLPGAGF